MIYWWLVLRPPQAGQGLVHWAARACGQRGDEKVCLFSVSADLPESMASLLPASVDVKEFRHRNALNEVDPKVGSCHHAAHDLLVSKRKGPCTLWQLLHCLV